MLEPDELTILTSWAEAAADALVFAPKRIEAVPVAAQAGASWRARLRIPEPSPSLSHALSSMTQAVRSTAATGAGPPLDALRQGIGDSQPDEPALDRLVYAVLRTALEQRARPAKPAKAESSLPLHSCRRKPQPKRDESLLHHPDAGVFAWQAAELRAKRPARRVKSASP